jgi:hypothetical protein
MDAAELHAKATIAAALITSRVVSIPTLPKDTKASDPAALHLRLLTEYVYAALVGPVES